MASTFVVARGELSTGTTNNMLFSNLPGLQNNDVMVLAVNHEDGSNGTITAPVGWTQIGTQKNNGSGGTLGSAIFWRAANNESGTLTVNYGVSSNGVMLVLVFRSVNTTTPIVDQAGSLNGTGATVDIPALTYSAQAVMLVAVASATVDSGITQPSGFTEPTNGEKDDASNFISLEMSYKNSSAANAAATTAGLPFGTLCAGFQIALKDASAAKTKTYGLDSVIKANKQTKTYQLDAKIGTTASATKACAVDAKLTFIPSYLCGFEMGHTDELFIASGAGTIGLNALTSGINTSGGTSFATASISPGANRLVLVAVAAHDATDPPVPGISGGGMTTWTQVSDLLFDTSGATHQRLTVFRAMQASPSSGAITFTFSPAIDDVGWSVVEFTGVDTSGANGSGAVVQSPTTNTGLSGTSGSITLSTAGNTANRAWSLWVHHATEGTTPRTNWTEIHDVSGAAFALETQWRSDTFETTASATWATSIDYGGAAIEVKAAGGPDTAVTVQNAITHSGGYALQVNPSATVVSNYNTSSRANGGSLRSIYQSSRFYLRIDTMPSNNMRLPCGDNVDLYLNSNGTFTGQVLASGTNQFVTSNALTADTKWHKIEFDAGWSAGNGVRLYIDGLQWGTVSTGSVTTSTLGRITGSNGTSLTGNFYIDDLIFYQTPLPDFRTNWKVALLKPISDNSRAVSWVAGAGGTANLFDAVDSVPPAGATAETNTSQIKNITSTSTANYDVNIQSYLAGGLVSTDLVTAIMPILNHGQVGTLSARAGEISVISNPDQSSAGQQFDYGDNAGVAAGDFPTGWYTGAGQCTGGSFILANNPIVRIGKRTATTNEVDADFMGLYVDYTDITFKNYGLDADLKGAVQKSYALDVSSRGTITRAYSLDVIRKLIAKPTYSLDARVVVGITTSTKAFSLVVLLRQTQAKTSSLDTSLKKTLTQAYALDSVKLRTNKTTHSVDILNRLTSAKTYALDTSLKKTQAQTYSLDSSIRSTLIKTHGLVVFIIPRFSKTYAIDVILKATQSKSCSLDTVIRATLTRTHAIDVIAVATRTRVYSLAASIKATLTKTYSLDITIKAISTKIHSLNVLLNATNVKIFAINTIMVSQATKIHNLDTLLRGTIQRTYSLDTQIGNRKTVLHKIDSKLSTAKSYAITATLRAKGNIKLLEPGTDATFGTEFWDTVINFVSGSSNIGQTGPRYLYSSAAGGAIRKNGVLADTGRRISLWFRAENTNNGDLPLVQSLTSTSVSFEVYQDPASGKLIFWANSFSFSKLGTTVISAQTWYRVSVAYVITSATNYTINVFLNGNLEITVTQADVSLATIGGTIYGIGDNSVREFEVDSVYIDDATTLDDPGNIKVTAKRPTTTINNAFGNTGGTGAVNERPINTANYKAETSISTNYQSYNIESASAGDVNITNRTIVGALGWIWAARGSGYSGGAPRLRFNGIDTTVSLSAAAALFNQTTNASTYPTEIGMRAAGNTDDTFLYENGVVIAYIEDQTTRSSAYAIDVQIGQNRIFKTYTLDSNLRATLNKTSAIDVVVRKQSGLNHAVNVVLLAAQAKTYALSVAILQTLSKTYSLDALLRATKTATYNLDISLKATKNKTYTLDAIIRSGQTKTHTLDTLLRATQKITYAIDISLRTTLSKTYSIDVIKRKTNTLTYALDVLLLAKQSSTYTLIVLIVSRIGKTYALDTSIRTTQTRTYSIDTLTVNRRSITYAVDILLRATQTRTYSANTAIAARRTIAYSLDTTKRTTGSQTYLIDMIVRLTTKPTYTLTTSVASRTTHSYQLDTSIKALASTRVTTIDTVIRATTTRTYSLDTFLQRAGTTVYSLNALLRESNTKITYQLEVCIARRTIQTHLLDAFTVTRKTKTYALDALTYAHITTTDILIRYSTTAGTAGNQNAGTGNGSLGKYVATNQLLVGLHLLFDEVRSDEDAADESEYRCVFIYNSHAYDTLKNIKIYLSAEVAGGANAAIGIDPTAASDIASTAAQALTIANEDTAPAGVTFSSPTTAGTALNLGDLAPQQVRAVWIRRTTNNSGQFITDGITLGIRGEI